MLARGSTNPYPDRRVIAYIDGFNVYYGLKNASRDSDYQLIENGGDLRDCLGRSLYWLDLQQVVESQLLRSERCHIIKYFSAPRGVPQRVAVEDKAAYIASNERQRVYLDALATRPLVEVVLGWYSEHKPHTCASCGAQWPRFEEKVTDVNIATYMISDAYEDRFDMAYLISADADLVPPVQAVRALGKEVVLGLFPGRKRAEHLRRNSDRQKGIRIRSLRNNLLPQIITRVGLPPLVRPLEWNAPDGWIWTEQPPIPRSGSCGSGTPITPRYEDFR